MKVIHSLPEITVTRSFPKNLKEGDKDIFSRLRERRLDEVKVFQLSEVSILAQGTIFKGMNVYRNLLLSNDQEYLNCPNWKGLLGIYYSYRKKRLSEDLTYILVHNCYSHTYYHWLLEVLPRLFLVKDFLETGKVLIPRNHSKPFHQDTLNVFGVKQIQFIEEKYRYVIPNLVVPSQIGRMANYHPEVISQTVAFIKQKICLKLNLGDRIYISRSKASRRKVVNEEEVIQVLKQLGFAIVHFEDYSWAEQVSIMHHCRYLVGLHGAGLANIIFMQLHGRVYELRKFDEGENYFFFTLASTVNLNYYYQFCNSPEEGVNVQDADIWVDIAQFMFNINLFLTERT